MTGVQLDRARLDQDGFAVVPFFEPPVVAELGRRFASLGIERTHAFFVSLSDLAPDGAREVDLLLKRRGDAAMRPLLAGHRAFMAAFISKGACDGARCDYHQDLTYTDERTARAVLTWTPLVDVGPDNGAMRVVPGSHRWTSKIRAGSRRELPTAALQDDLDRLGVDVTLRAGEALVYDPALVHGSMPNRSDEVRPVAAIAFAPNDAVLVHFHLDEGGALEGFAVDDRLGREQSLLDRPVGYPAFGAWTGAVTTEDLRAALPG